MRYCKISLLLFCLTLAVGCASTAKKAATPTMTAAKYTFAQGERFLTYDFYKRKTISAKDGHSIDIRESIVRRFEILETDPHKGSWIRMTYGRIEQTRFSDDSLSGSAIAEHDGGIVQFKGDPGTTEETFYDRIQKVVYLRIDRFGRLMAKGFSDPLPENPLDTSDWHTVRGFTMPEHVLVNPFLFVASSPILTVGDEWKSIASIPLDHAGASAEMEIRHRVSAAGESTVQVVAFGDPTGTIQGAETVQSGRYFQQTVFDTKQGFIQNVKIEWEIQYTAASGEKFKESRLVTSNNTKAKRKKR